MGALPPPPPPPPPRPPHLTPLPRPLFRLPGYLSIGIILHLDVIRQLFLFFLFATIFSIPAMYQNANGGFTLLDVDNDVLQYISVAPSIAALAGPTYTPIQDNYCNGRGFAAQVCLQDGWSPGVIDLYDYSCGAGSSNLSTSVTTKTITSGFGALATYCEKTMVLCYCVQGYSGSRCQNGVSRARMLPGPGGPPGGPPGGGSGGGGGGSLSSNMTNSVTGGTTTFTVAILHAPPPIDATFAFSSLGTGITFSPAVSLSAMYFVLPSPTPTLTSFGFSATPGGTAVRIYTTVVTAQAQFNFSELTNNNTAGNSSANGGGGGPPSGGSGGGGSPSGSGGGGGSPSGSGGGGGSPSSGGGGSSGASPEFMQGTENLPTTFIPGAGTISNATGAPSAAIQNQFKLLPGFCIPTVMWWQYKVGATLRITEKKKSDALRSSFFCSGRGACGVHFSPGTWDMPSFSFCQCDSGYFGAYCENAENSTAWSGIHSGNQLNYPYSSSDAKNCDQSPVPSSPNYAQSDVVVISPMRCSKHGFGVVLPLQSNGQLNYSNYYRPQTRGVCFCEPGYGGEECLGGPQLPPVSAGFACLISFCFFLMIPLAYRRRKLMQQTFDDLSVTPSDFTVFVSSLPQSALDPLQTVATMTWDADAPGGGADVTRLKAHFEQFGPVHDVSPALNDKQLIFLVRNRHAAMQAFAMGLERNAQPNCEGIVPTNSSDTILHARPAWYPATVPRALLVNMMGYGQSTELSIDYIEREASKAIAAEKAAGATNLLSKLFTRFIGGVSPALLSPKRLVAYLADTTEQIEKAKADAKCRTFSGAFVTFSFSEDAKAALSFYRSSNTTGGVVNRRTNVVVSASKELAPAPGVHDAKPTRLSVKKACEPDEVWWENLNATVTERSIFTILTFGIFSAVCVALIYIVNALNELKASATINSFVVALLIVLVNKIVVKSWPIVSKFEGAHSFGSWSRSVFLKSFFQQAFVTLLCATIAIYGVPIDSKNGYRVDWFNDAGAYLLKTVLIEAFIPPIMLFLAVMHRVRVFAGRSAKSHVEWIVSKAPPRITLEQRTAALMQHILIGCIFSPGLPVLYAATALALINSYLADMAAIDGIYRLSRVGVENARVVEFTIFLAVIAQVTMNFLIYRVGAEKSSNVFVEAIYFIIISFLIWILLGYVSFKRCRARDCCFGFGRLFPHKVAAPLYAVNEKFMNLALGDDFFGKEDEDDETGGKTYAELSSESQRAFTERHTSTKIFSSESRLTMNSFFLLRRMPYRCVERAELYAALRIVEPTMPIWAPISMHKWVKMTVARSIETEMRSFQSGPGTLPGIPQVKRLGYPIHVAKERTAASPSARTGTSGYISTVLSAATATAAGIAAQVVV